MIDGRARRMMKRARTPKEVSGDPTDQRPGYHRTVRNAAEQLGTICERATTGYVRIGDGCRVWLWRRRG